LLEAGFVEVALRATPDHTVRILDRRPRPFCVAADGSACEGDAKVSTTLENGKTLISSISANC